MLHWRALSPASPAPRRSLRPDGEKRMDLDERGHLVLNALRETLGIRLQVLRRTLELAAIAPDEAHGRGPALTQLALDARPRALDLALDALLRALAAALELLQV